MSTHKGKQKQDNLHYLSRFTSKSVAGAPEMVGTCDTFAIFSLQVESASQRCLDELDTACKLLFADERHDVSDA